MAAFLWGLCFDYTANDYALTLFPSLPRNLCSMGFSRLTGDCFVATNTPRNGMSLLMRMPVMNIGHVIVLMFLGGMLMLVRVDFPGIIVFMCGVIMVMLVFVE